MMLPVSQSHQNTPKKLREFEAAATPSPMRVPECVLALVSRCPTTDYECEGGYHVLHFRINSDGHSHLVDWASSGVVDPFVTAFIDPTMRASAAAACEARSIVQYCAELSADDCRLHVMGPPLAAPCRGVNIHHAKVALTYLLTTIAAPPQTYVAINALRSGEYICTIQYAYKNSLQSTDVCKR